MYLEHFRLNKSPFSEEPNPEIFFPGAGRQEIFASLLQDIEAGKPLIKLIGSKGSGKTLLCRLLIEHLPRGHEAIYLDNPVGSFEALLRVICLDLGMEPPGDDGATDILAELHLQLRLRVEQQHRVVLVIDEAEKLFLATLERMVRVICDTDEAGMLTILLAGRSELDANLDQLTVYCSNLDINAGYLLQPLTRKETGQYLNFRMMTAGLTGEKQQDIFTSEAVEKIFDSARGNLRMTNILAEESLRHSCTDKSFLVLLDHVATEPEKEKPVSRRLAGFPGLRMTKRIWWSMAGAALVALVLLLFLLPPGRKQEPPAVTSSGRRAVVPAPADHTTGSEPHRAALETTFPASQQKETGPAAQERTTTSITVRQPTLSSAMDAEILSAQEKGRDGDRLFRQRLGASAGWLAGAYRGGYTIQLMMLTSAEATGNIKRMLTRDAYFNVLDKLYILRKKTSPPTLFVFYGTYDSMDAAREARNKMPIFLRKHHPYALAISDALKKTED